MSECPRLVLSKGLSKAARYASFRAKHLCDERDVMCELGALSLVYPASPQAQVEGSVSNDKYVQKYGKPGS